MKISVPLRTHTGRIVPALIASMLLSATVHTYGISPKEHTFSSSHYFDSILIEKQFTSRKHKIRLYPNANQEVLFFSATGEERKMYQLYLFDMDGQLVKQANIKNKQTTVVTNIEKGVYLFEVFSNDERIETGTVTVR